MAVTAALTGLQPGTTYYDEVVATNAGGTTDGTILSFTTLAAPSRHDTGGHGRHGHGGHAQRQRQSPGERHDGRLRLRHRPHIDDRHDHHRRSAIGSGTSAVAVTAALTGLQPGTTYYDEVVATNAGGTTDGAILSFTTPPRRPPAATTQAATGVTARRRRSTAASTPRAARRRSRSSTAPTRH